MIESVRPKAPAAIAATLAALDERMGGERETLDAFLLALSRNQLPEGAWQKLAEAAARDGRVAEVAFAFEELSQDKRIKTLTAALAAEFFFQAATFFQNTLGDNAGALGFVNRALAAQATHVGARQLREVRLLSEGDFAGLGAHYAESAATRPKAEQVEQLKRAAAAFEQAPEALDRLIEVLTTVVRLDPNDAQARTDLASALGAAGRTKELSRLLEQTIASQPDAPAARRKLIAIYTAEKRELERAMPHVEALLAEDPRDSEALQTAALLLEIRTTTARAAEALATATEATGEVAAAARHWATAAEQVRGPKRVAALKRLAALRRDRLGDDAGAFEAADAALVLDAGDGELMTQYVALARSLGKQADALRTLQRAGASAREAEGKGRVGVEIGVLLAEAGDPKRARSALQTVLAAAEISDGLRARASHALASLLEQVGDFSALAEVLDGLARIETDADARQRVLVRIAELAGAPPRDHRKAMTAWRALLTTAARERAMAELEALLAEHGDDVALAALLRERASEATDPASARDLLVRAARALSGASGHLAEASASWRAIVERFGPDAETLRSWLPLLELEGDIAALTGGLEALAKLTQMPERAKVLTKLGLVRLERGGDPPGGAAALAESFALDDSDDACLRALAALVDGPDDEAALIAARSLEPRYRAEGSPHALLGLLEERARRSPDVGVRIETLLEATEIAGALPDARPRAIALACRGLREALDSSLASGEWLTCVAALTDSPAHARSLPAALLGALGGAPVSSDARLAVALRAARSAAALRDVGAAIDAYRLALAYRPGDAALAFEFEALLREQGSPADRLALLRATLAHGGDATTLGAGHRAIAALLRDELGDPAGALAELQRATALDPDDLLAENALVDLLVATGRAAEGLAILETRARRAPSGGERRAVQVKIAELASVSGLPEVASASARGVLGDADVTGEDLDVVEAVAERLGDIDLVRDTFAARTSRADGHDERIFWLTRLGELEGERRNDADAAATAWKAAARLARENDGPLAARKLFERALRAAPGDRESMTALAQFALAAQEWNTRGQLLRALAASETSPSAMAAALMLLAEHLRDREGDALAAFEAASRAFEAIPDDASLLHAAVAYAHSAGSAAAFAKTLEIATERVDAAEPRAQLALAAARLRCADSVKEAVWLLKPTLASEALDGAFRAQLARALEQEIARVEPASIERRALLAWLHEHASGAEHASAAMDWGRFEEAHGDAPRALALFKEAMELGAAAAADVARLLLAAGDVEAAIAVLRADAADGSREAQRGSARALARLLAEHPGFEPLALAEVEALLDERPDDAEAIRIVARLMSVDACRERASALLESALAAPGEPAERAVLLEALLAGALDAPADSRQRWLVALVDACRAISAAETLRALVRSLPEVPLDFAWWDEAELLARELDRPQDVADTYRHALASKLSPDDLLELGARAVAFHEEWFEDTSQTIRILDQLVDAQADGGWAFDRLRLLYDSQERWDDLFELCDRVIARASDARRAELLDEVAQIAKDFAKNSDRAIGYFEQLLMLRPTSERLIAALERLYERSGRHRDLIALLGARVGGASDSDARALRVRMAQLWLDELGDAGAALLVTETLIEAADDQVTSTRLLERVLATALPHDEVKRELPVTSSPASESVAAARPSQRPLDPSPRKAGPAAVLVRARAAALLAARYAAPGQERNLARVLEVEIEYLGGDESAQRHRDLIALHAGLGDPGAALEHAVALFLHDPADAANRGELERFAASTGRFDRLADVLERAATGSEDVALSAALRLQAGLVWSEAAGDSARAIEQLTRVAFVDGATITALAAATQLEQLLRAARREHERLGILERIAALTAEPTARRMARGDVARLAAQLGEIDRAINAWEACLADAPGDLEALTGLADLLEADGRSRPLVAVLSARAAASTDAADVRRDHVHIAHILEHALSDRAGAIEAWLRVEAGFGETDETVACLTRLHGALGDHAALCDVLSRAIARATSDDSRAALGTQRGDLLRAHLGDDSGAARAYAAALDADITARAAREGLRALADSPEAGPLATRTLLAVLARAEDWTAFLELTPHRLRTAADAPAKVAIFVESARIAEQHTRQQDVAFEWLQSALLESAGDPDIEVEAARLAELTNNWERHLGTLTSLEPVIAQSGEPERLTALRLSLAHVLDEKLGALGDSLAAYERILSSGAHSPSAAALAISVAARAGRFDAMATVALRHTRDAERLDGALVECIERSLQAAGAWSQAARAFEAAVCEQPDLTARDRRDLEGLIGIWHRDRLGDLASAEAAFYRALAHAEADIELLQALAELQRKAPGPSLVQTLLRLARGLGDDLQLMREAAEVAIRAADREGALAILMATLDIAATRWQSARAGDVPAQETELEQLVEWVLAELARIHDHARAPRERVALALRAAGLPFSSERRRALEHEAAHIAETRAEDIDAAQEIYARLFAESAHDAVAAQRLTAIYTDRGDGRALLGVRRRELAEGAGSLARPDLLAEIARIEVTLGNDEAAFDALNAGLAEAPRHPGCAAALAALLERGARFEELFTLLQQQAARAETDGDRAEASSLYSRSAEVARAQLADSSRAESALGLSLTLELRIGTLRDLAQLLEARGDHAGAAKCLDQLLQQFPGERTGNLCWLARNLESSGRDDLAQQRLEGARADGIEPQGALAMLEAIYRRTDQHLPLADILAKRAARSLDSAEQLAVAREAAALYLSPCAMPERAIPLLELARRLAPDDRDLSLLLADALRAAGRSDDARDLLKDMLSAFAGRRPKERAVVHFYLARLALTTGSRPQALAELEAATRIDPTNAEILRAVAELARDDGQFEKAERSYRALLAVLRRQAETDPRAPIVRAEVFLELSLIAQRQGENDRAGEILESAFEAAATSDVDAARLDAALRAQGRHADLARSLEARIARAGHGALAATLLADLARLSDEHLAAPEPAFRAAMRALSEAPELPVILDGALALCAKLGRLGDCIDQLEREAARAAAAGDLRLAGSLFMRSANELAATDPARASRLFAHAESSPEVAIEALRAQRQLHESLGDFVAETAALKRLALRELESPDAESSASAELFCELGERLLGSSDSVDEACLWLGRAMSQPGQIDRLVAALACVGPPDETRMAFLNLLERVGREPEQQATLFRALSLRARSSESGAAVAEEAARLALSLGNDSAADALLELCEARAVGDRLPTARWAAAERARLSETRGDEASALRHLARASEHAGSDDARALRLEVARRALPIGAAQLAISMLERAVDAQPDDHEALAALALAYRAQADHEKLADLLGRRIDLSTTAEARAELRRERAELLADALGRPEEAARELEALFDEDPRDAASGAMLLRLLEASGDEIGLERVLLRLIDAAKDREDAEAVGALSLRLGAIVEKRNADDARDVYLAALDWRGDDVRLLLAALGATSDPIDRSELLSKLIPFESGEVAEKHALELGRLRIEAWDEVGEERAYELGLAAFPGSTALKERLEKAYAARGDLRKSAELLETIGRGATDDAEAARTLIRAAAIFDTELGDLKAAARVLRAAVARDPGNSQLFDDMLSCAERGGDFDGAQADLTTKLTSMEEAPASERARVFGRRARMLAESGDPLGAIADAEAAFAADSEAHATLLIELLERTGASIESPERARDHAVRLATALAASSREAEATVHVEGVLLVDDSHTGALELMAALHTRAGRHDDAARVFDRITAITPDSEVAALALRLVTIGASIGAPSLARQSLERAWAIDPGDAAVSAELKSLYEAADDAGALAAVLMSDARTAASDDTRFDALMRAGALYLEADDAGSATLALTAAQALRPTDLASAALVAEALFREGRLDEATRCAQSAIVAQKGRRSPEIGALYHVLARVERALASDAGEVSMLMSAFEADGQSATIASELAEAAAREGKLELAQKALRAITMLKGPSPLPKAEAYARLGAISIQQGDSKRAIALLKRAVAEDAGNSLASRLLQTLSGE